MTSRTRTRPSATSAADADEAWYVSFTVTYDVEPTFDFVSVNSGDVTWARLSGEDTATILVPATDGKASSGLYVGFEGPARRLPRDVRRQKRRLRE